MAKHVLIVFGMLLMTGGVIHLAVGHASGSIADQAHLMVTTVLSMACLFVTAIVSFFTYRNKERVFFKYSILAASCATLAGVIPNVVQLRRVDHTKKQLAEVYFRIAEKGPPFPSHEEGLASVNRIDSTISRGYWVGKDRQEFEIYFHHSSNSYTMAYPVDRWEWRGNRYRGPDR